MRPLRHPSLIDELRLRKLHLTVIWQDRYAIPVISPAASLAPWDKVQSFVHCGGL
jgi:hypothetical protein